MNDEHLRQFYDRWDRLEQDKAALQADLRELFAEMKGEGYDPKAARLAFRRKAKQDDETDADRAFDATVDAYVAALGTPIATRAPASAYRAHETPHDPETGEVQETEPGEGGGDAKARRTQASPAAPPVPSAGGAHDEMPDIPDYLRRTRAA